MIIYEKNFHLRFKDNRMNLYKYIFSILYIIFIFGEAMETKPYGSWISPISSNDVVKKSIKFGQIHIDQNTIYWTEGRPEEKGRVALVEKTVSSMEKDSLENFYNIRTTAHEYGGKCFFVQNKIIYFVNYSDQQIYKKSKDQIEQLTNLDNHRFADFVIDSHGKYLYGVCEKHSPDKVTNMLICLNIETKHIDIIASGFDFYMSPRLSPDNLKLTWVCWNHPNMPWDGTELWLADINGPHIKNAQQLAGDINESIVDPSFSETGDLFFISDKSGWWNFYKYKNDQISAVCPCEIEFGRPAWIFGESTYSFIKIGSSLKIAARGLIKGISCLYLIDIDHKKKEILDSPFTYISHIYTLDDKIIFIGASASQQNALVAYDIKSSSYEILKQSQKISLDLEDISQPSAFTFSTEKGQMAYGFYYPPTNKNYQAPSDEKPPVIVECHGGPTAQVFPRFNMEYQYFTSRGIAVFDINYGGSCGYGRLYRDRLRGNWGLVDVFDCENGAKHLIEKGLIDKNRIVIKGGSAGGFTTLASLAFTDIFKAGVSYYGVGDLVALAQETHKFEAKYLDNLIAPYPRHKELYLQRSPINNLEKFSAPVLLFQGSEDKVVPKTQAEIMYEALKKKGLPTAYILFEGEGHGFRISSNIKKALEAELYFYSQIFNFPLSEKISKIKIENLKTK